MNGQRKTVAALDLGTNTFLCLVAEVWGEAGERQIKMIQDDVRLVRLGEKVDSQREFTKGALSRARDALSDFYGIIKKHNPSVVIATATSAARDVKNGHELLEIGEEFEIPIRIISGQKEALLSFEGAISGISKEQLENLMVLDIGGGSTEMIFQSGTNELLMQSFDIGAVRLTEQLLPDDPIKPEQIKRVLKHSKEVMASFSQHRPKLMVGVSGTPTTLACMLQSAEFDESKVDKFVIRRNPLMALIEKAAAMPLESRKKIMGLPEKRADVIVAGGIILLAAMETVGLDQIQVSTRGLRYGLALNYDQI